jgi:hypothetical protein
VAFSEKHKALLSTSNRDAKRQEDADRAKILIQNYQRMSTQSQTQAEAAQADQLALACDNNATGLVFASVDTFNNQEGSDFDRDCNSNYDANNADLEVNDFYPGASEDELVMEVNKMGAKVDDNAPSDDDNKSQAKDNKPSSCGLDDFVEFCKKKVFCAPY